MGDNGYSVIGYIFWDLTVGIGITSATGNSLLGIIGSIIMTAFMLITSKES